MARVIDDIGALGRATKPLGLRAYEPGSLPDPSACTNALIIVNDRSDGVPRGRLALSNGASWDILAFALDLTPGAAAPPVPVTIDVTAIVDRAVAERLPALIAQQPMVKVVSPSPMPAFLPDPDKQRMLDALILLTDRVADLEEQLAFVMQNGATTKINVNIP